MFPRKKRNRTGTISVVVVDKSRGGFKEVKSFGVAKTETEADRLYAKAAEWVRKYGDTPAAYARTMYFSDDEGDETMGVSGIAAAADSDRQWYDMSGRRLAGKPTKSGIYVIDG